MIKSKIIFLIILSTLFAAASIISGCCPFSDMNLSKLKNLTEDTKVAEDTGVPIEAKIGEKFKIALDSNQTTGYQWELSEPLDESVVKLVGSEYISDKPITAGSGGVEVWTFEAVGEGETEISMAYVRSWEKDVEPAQSKTFKVAVKNK
jgi:inhibitor of cysteine peptidase